MSVADKTAPSSLNLGPYFLGRECKPHICVESLCVCMVLLFSDL